jgi:hypothetical protein
MSLTDKLLTLAVNLTKGSSGFEVIDATTTTTTGSLQYDNKASGTLPYDNASGAFTNGETITGGTSAATAIVVSKTLTVFTLRAITGTFQNNEQLTGGTSGTTADVNGTVTFFDFQAWETVTGTTSSATATVVSTSGTELELSSISGVFQNNELLTGSVSAATALADGTLKYNDAGNWCKIKADGAADAVIDKLVFANGNTAETITLLKGDELAGQITNIRLTSGKLIAYPNLPTPTL